MSKINELNEKLIILLEEKIKLLEEQKAIKEKIIKMSEIVHYRGIATKIDQPNNKTLIDVAKDILKERNKEIADYYDNAIECLCDTYYHEFFYHSKTQTLYKLDNNEYKPDEDIIRAKLKENGTIKYELRYYNGGASFDECIEEAFNNI